MTVNTWIKHWQDLLKWGGSWGLLARYLILRCHASEGWHLGELACLYMKEYYVYIMASRRNGTLYTGVTSDLIRRVYQHKSGAIKGFTSKYKINKLVYYEVTSDIYQAIKREKNIQAWKRAWKLRLIEENNPNWNDLYEQITGCQPSLA